MKYIKEDAGPDDLSNIDMVTKVAAFLYAKRYDDTVPFEDYKHYGVIGYLEAQENFDPKKGASFRTFAIYRIKGAILNGISKYTEKLDISFFRAKAKQSTAFLKAATHEERFDQFASQVVELTLESLMDDVFDGLLTEPDDCENDILEHESATKLLVALDDLLDYEREVIIYYYFYDFSFKTIAEYMNLSKGRISQLHSVAMKKLFDKLSENSSFLSYL